MITIEEIKHLEDLSNLEYSQEEREKFISEFEDILDFASQINNANCENNSNFNTIKLGDLREDKCLDSLSQEQILLNAPEKKNGCFVVPKIVE